MSCPTKSIRLSDLDKGELIALKSEIDLHIMDRVDIANTPKKYRICIFMDTDDDCPITYYGTQYCFYGEPLDIVGGINHVNDISTFLDSIEVGTGYKLTDFTKDWLLRVKNYILSECFDALCNIDINSNQTFSCRVTTK
jgi:hypothetical protein